LDDKLSDAQLFAVKMVDNYFTDIVHFLSTGMAPSDMTVAQNKQLVVKAADYQLIARNLYKLGVDGILLPFVLEHERKMILAEAHDGIAGSHYARKAKTQKILHIGIWWPTLHKDAKKYFHSCDIFQRVGRPS
jgi:hypothetical protein